MFKAVTPLKFQPGLGVENIQRGLQLGQQLATTPQQTRLLEEKIAAARQLLPYVTESKEALAQLAPEAKIAETTLKERQAPLAVAHAQKIAAALKSPLAVGGIPLHGTAASIMSNYAVNLTHPELTNQINTQQNIDNNLKKARTHYFNANYFLKNLTPVAKEQALQNYNNEQSIRQKQGLPKQTFQDWYTHTSSTQHPVSAGGTPRSPIAFDTTHDAGTLTSSNSPTGQSLDELAQPQGANKDIQVPAEDFKNEAKQLGLSILKRTTDPDARKRYRFAINGETTLKKMQPDISGVTFYSKNPTQLPIDIAQARLGKYTSNYNHYVKFVTNASLLAKQVAQFYGTSIQPEEQRAINDLTNPYKWSRSPQEMLARLNAFTSTFQLESDNYRRGLEDPNFILQKHTPTTFTDHSQDLTNQAFLQSTTRESSAAGQPAQTGTPTRQQFMTAARKAPQNKGVSDNELSDFYNKKYGGK